MWICISYPSYQYTYKHEGTRYEAEYNHSIYCYIYNNKVLTINHLTLPYIRPRTEYIIPRTTLSAMGFQIRGYEVRRTIQSFYLLYIYIYNNNYNYKRLTISHLILTYIRPRTSYPRICKYIGTRGKKVVRAFR